MFDEESNYLVETSNNLFFIHQWVQFISNIVVTKSPGAHSIQLAIIDIKNYETTEALLGD